MIDFLFIIILALTAYASINSRLAEIVLLFLLLIILVSVAGWLIVIAMLGIVIAALSE